jgi:hypothetical protein
MPVWLLKFLPSILKYGVVVLVAIALLWGAYSKGVEHTETKWAVKQAEVAVAFAQENARLSVLKNTVEIKYRDKIVKVKEIGETIIKEVPVYVTAQDDLSCDIGRGFVELHDAAAANRLPNPSPTGESNETFTGPRLSDVGRTVTINYGKFHEMRTQCAALQDWAAQLTVTPPSQ